MKRLYPAELPKVRCDLCGRMASRADWYLQGFDSHLRRFICPYNHIFYIQVTPWFLEVEKYLYEGKRYDKKIDHRK